MQKVFIAIALSLGVHLLTLYYFNGKVVLDNKPKVNTSNKLEAIGYQKIKYVKLVKSEKQKVIQPKVKKPIIKKKKPPKKEIIKKQAKVVKQKPKPKQKFIKVPKKQAIKKVVKRPQPKVIAKPVIKQAPKPQLPTAKEIYEQTKKEDLKEIQKLDEVTKSYLKLYGEEYFKFSKETKKYLNDNINNIGRVTQKYLRYPRIAIKTKQQGMNIVQFFLYPNGDITDLKITNGSGYRTLDKNTIKTIKLAYKDYPRPKEKTKVKIYVYYQLR